MSCFNKLIYRYSGAPTGDAFWWTDGPTENINLDYNRVTFGSNYYINDMNGSMTLIAEIDDTVVESREIYYDGDLQLTTNLKAGSVFNITGNQWNNNIRASIIRWDETTPDGVDFDNVSDTETAGEDDVWINQIGSEGYVEYVYGDPFTVNDKLTLDTINIESSLYSTYFTGTELDDGRFPTCTIDSGLSLDDRRRLWVLGFNVSNI